MERIDTKAAPLRGRVISTNGHARDPLSDEVREYCEGVLYRLLWSEGKQAQPLRTLGITSCRRGEGVTTVATQLAITAATSGEIPVLLVDANRNHPALHRLFPVLSTPGWGDVIGEQRCPSVAIQPSGVDRLAILPAGRAMAGRGRAAEESDLADVFKAIKAEYELIVFDLGHAGDPAALSLAGALEGVLLVIEAERVRWEEAERVKSLLAGARAKLLGAVLNKRRQYLPRWFDRA